MTKWLILILMMVMMSTLAQALPLQLPVCDDHRIKPNGANCSIVTPSINCSSFTYDLVNMSGVEIVNDGSLTELNDTVYFFNFTQTQSEGVFIVRLCNGVTQQITVEGDEELTNIAVSLLYISSVVIYMAFGMLLKDKNIAEFTANTGIFKIQITEKMLTALKALYFLTIPAFVLLGLHIAREMALANGAPVSITDSLVTAFQIFGSIYVFTLGIFLIILIKNSISVLADTSSSVFTRNEKLTNFKRRGGGREEGNG